MGETIKIDSVSVGMAVKLKAQCSENERVDYDPSRGFFIRPKTMLEKLRDRLERRVG